MIELLEHLNNVRAASDSWIQRREIEQCMFYAMKVYNKNTN